MSCCNHPSTCPYSSDGRTCNKQGQVCDFLKVSNTNTTEYYQPLFNLMSEHNLTLLEGEMDEIIECVTKMIDKSKKQFDAYKLI
jgi:hypothetical protein